MVIEESRVSHLFREDDRAVCFCCRVALLSWDPADGTSLGGRVDHFSLPISLPVKKMSPEIRV